MHIVECLAAFLERYRSNFPFASDGLVGGITHIRFPSGYGTLVGSDRGRLFWETTEAIAVLEALLAIPPFSAWFEGDSPITKIEVKGTLASFVERWLGTNLSPQQFAEQYAQDLQQQFARPEVKVVAYQVAYGLGLDQPYVELPFGFALGQVFPEALQGLLTATGNSTLEIIRSPNVPSLFLIKIEIALRDQWRAISATTAMSYAAMNLNRLREAIWLNSGVVLNLGDLFYFQDSDYPSLAPARSNQFLGFVFRRQGPKTPIAQSNFQTLADLILRMGWVWGYWADNANGDNTIWPVLDALEYAEVALNTASPRVAVLTAYAGMESLLTKENEEHGDLVRRIRHLISGDLQDRRQTVRVLDQIHRVRGKIAHGHQPARRDLERASGQQFTDSMWPEDQSWRALIARCLTLLRRTIVAYVFCTVNAAVVDGQWVCKSALSRDELLDLLDSATKNDMDAARIIRERIPDIAHHPWVGTLGSD